MNLEQAAIESANIRVLHLVQRHLEIVIALRHGREEPNDADRKEAQRTVRPARRSICGCYGSDPDDLDWYGVAEELKKPEPFNPVKHLAITIPQRLAEPL